MKKTIKDLLSERETKLTNKTFLFWEDDQVSYSKMLETAKKIASSLADKGINKDDKICIWLTNRPEFHLFNVRCGVRGRSACAHQYSI